MSKLLIVSNRLPVTVTTGADGFGFRRSTGGLVTGLSSLLKSEETRWIGWHGFAEDNAFEHQESLAEALRGMDMHSLSLSREEVQSYYNDFSNGILWPLYHYQAERMPLTLTGWESYQEVNERFCETVAQVYEDGDFIWIQDYHLQLLPALLRTRFPKARIGFFLHIPFPSSEVFRILPWRAQILEGLLGADVIGFHTHAYARHFESALLRILGIDAYADQLIYNGRTVKIGAFPLGVDVDRIVSSLPSAQCELASALMRMKNDENIQKIMLSIDRLDYTKGLPRRLLAFEKLLEENPDVRGAVSFVQIAAPSRDQVPAYESCRSQVEGLVGRINGRFGLPGYQPIHYISRNFSQEEILALYPLVDVMVVTPLRDGMNLVAKEFIATREDLDGVLVLSEFAGAADELGEAIQVNPYDINDAAAGMLTAIQMSADERRDRMSALRNRVNGFDASVWARKFIDFLHGDVDEKIESICYVKPESLLPEVHLKQKKVLFLDYDGTLFPIVRIPQLAKPDKPLLMLLKRLSKHPDMEVHIVSGRSHAVLEQWLGELDVYLHAEHGAMSRSPWETQWTIAATHGTSNDWQPFVRSTLDDFTKNTPGSFVEEKVHSLAWHYRMSDPVLGEKMANELRLHARETFTPLGLEMLPGKRMVEVRRMGINKGMIISRELERVKKYASIVAIGDDVTDEDMFSALPAEAMTVVVGDQVSKARKRLRDSADVRRFLELLSNAS